MGKKVVCNTRLDVKSGAKKVLNLLNLTDVAISVFYVSTNAYRKFSLKFSYFLIALRPCSWIGYCRAAEILIELKRFTEAQEQIEAGLRKIPNHFRLLIVANNVFSGSGNCEKFLQYSEILLAHYPGSSYGYIYLAQALRLCNRFTEAIEVIDEGLNLFPSNESILLEAVDAYIQFGSYQKALTHCIQLSKISNNIYVCSQKLIHIYIVLNRFELAEEVLLHAGKFLSEGPAKRMRGEFDELKRLKDEKDLLLKVWQNTKLWVPTPASPENLISSSIEKRIGIKPIQYWSQQNVPTDIQEITATWNSLLAKLNLDKITVWSQLDAKKWIADNAPEFENAFNTAPHFASESDIFRLAYTKSYPCLWIDSDLYPKKWTSMILKKSISLNKSTFFMWDRSPFIQNSFFLSYPNCPIFAEIRKMLYGFSFYGKEPSLDLIHGSFGPGSYTKVIKGLLSRDHEVNSRIILQGLLELLTSGKISFLICNERSFAYMKKPGGLDYQKDPRLNWRNTKYWKLSNVPKR